MCKGGFTKDLNYDKICFKIIRKIIFTFKVDVTVKRSHCDKF